MNLCEGSKSSGAHSSCRGGKKKDVIATAVTPAKMCMHSALKSIGVTKHTCVYIHTYIRILYKHIYIYITLIESSAVPSLP
jgi:hypothetical protein